jgi:DnaK suppressor protein
MTQEKPRQCVTGRGLSAFHSNINAETKMTRKSSIEEMRLILTQRRNALVQALSGDDSLLKKFSQQQSGGDVVDFASDTAFGELSSQLAEVENRELQHVEAALKKIKDGTYGKCDACKGNIPLARLQAIPYAVYCIKCKRAAEDAGIDPSAVVDWSTILDTGYSSDNMDFNLS